jgi:hypothetical protein
MRRILISLIVTTLSTIASPSQRPQQVHGEGCVQPGAEARCIVVTDLKSGNLFALLIKGMPPEIGSGIEFTGFPHRGVTTCIQGTAVDVQTWSQKDSLKCGKTAPPTKWR